MNYSLTLFVTRKFKLDANLLKFGQLVNKDSKQNNSGVSLLCVWRLSLTLQLVYKVKLRNMNQKVVPKDDPHKRRVHRLVFRRKTWRWNPECRNSLSFSNVIFTKKSLAFFLSLILLEMILCNIILSKYSYLVSFKESTSMCRNLHCFVLLSLDTVFTSVVEIWECPQLFHQGSALQKQATYSKRTTAGKINTSLFCSYLEFPSNQNCLMKQRKASAMQCHVSIPYFLVFYDWQCYIVTKTAYPVAVSICC